MLTMNPISETLFPGRKSCRRRSWPALSRPMLAGCVLALGLLMGGGGRASAATYLLDPLQSTLVLSGKLAGSPMQEQGPGGHTTTYAGSIEADFSGSSIRFGGGSSIDANLGGIWQPAVGGTAGSAPADYGTRAGSVVGAGRNIVLDVASTFIAVSSGAFDATQISLTYLSGVVDYNAGASGSGTISLFGEFGFNNASGGLIAVAGNIETLTLPVQFSTAFTVASPDDSMLVLTGQLVATRTVPEPSSTALLFSCAPLPALWRRGRREGRAASRP